MSTLRPSIVHADLAVLRPPPLDDVHVRQDLDAAGDDRAHGGGQVEDVVQRAVDAVADPDPVRLRLDVDVRGAVAQRLGDDQLHDLDHRRVVVGRDGVHAGNVDPSVRVLRLEHPHLGTHTGEGTIGVAECLQNVGVRRHKERDRPA